MNIPYFRHVLATPRSAVDQAAPVLSARGLTVETRGPRGPISVLRDIDFTVRTGTTVGLVGESGAGKSMLGRVIARHLPPAFAVTGGTLQFQQTDLLAMPVAEHRRLLGTRIAFIPQEPMTALNPVMTIGQQFNEHLRRLGTPASSCRQRAVDALDEVRLPDPQRVLGKYAFELSGGMCQRVMIAMAFASDPDLVISDEATTALDASTQAHIVTLIRNLQERRSTGVVFVTHDLGLASHVCDDVVVLYAGEAIESGPTREVFAEPFHPYTHALQRANPQLTGPRQRLLSLPGQMPGISDFPGLAGCRFEQRCPVALPTCATQAPPLTQAAPTHQVRCVYGAAAPVPLASQDAANDAPHGMPATMSTEPFLVVRSLSKSYKSRGGFLSRDVEVPAVSAVDLSIAPGEFVGVVGESGSGKSTLGRLIMGLEKPAAGEVLLNGRPLAGDDWARRIASIQMIFQDPRSALNPRRQVANLITQAMEHRGHWRVERVVRATELVDDVGLAQDMLDRFPAQMSGGQRQRVNIGRALCDVPQLLIADEIVSGLDVSVQAQILNLLLRLRAEHKVALLLISHDLAVVRYLCSKVLVMHRGKVVESGRTEDVFASPSHPYTRSLLASVPPRDLDVRWPAPDAEH